MQASFLMSLFISDFTLTGLLGSMMLLASLNILPSLPAAFIAAGAFWLPCLGAILCQHYPLSQLMC